jgi:hypothetical protein
MVEKITDIKEALFGPVDQGFGPVDQGGATPTTPQGPGIDPNVDVEKPVKIIKINPQPLVLTNVSQYDIKKLRLPTNLNAYLEDPVAYVTNRVWNYDLKNTNNIEFGYRLPSDIDVNKKTVEFLAELFTYNEKVKSAFKTLTLIKENKPIQFFGAKIKPEQAAPILNKNFDNVFRMQFSLLVKDFLKKQFPNLNLEILEFADFPSLPFVKLSENVKEALKLIHNEPFLWFWINQIFAQNVQLIFKSIFKFKVDKKNIMALNFAAYFLSQRFSADAKNNYYDKYLESLKASFSGTVTDLPFDLNLSELVKGKTFVNKNNYLNKNKSTVQNALAVNYPDSPFFTYNKENFQKGEKSALPTAKQLKKCKDDKIGKEETGLRLFYKEGNDNILDEDPPGVLGCDTNTLSWDLAENILFDGDSLDTTKQRVNLSLPYYNSLRVSYKNDIPENLDVYKFLLNVVQKNRPIGLLKKDIDTFKGFNTLLIKNKLIKDENILTDKSLAALEDNPKSQILLKNYSVSDTSWGTAKFLKALPKSSELLFSEPPLYPFLGHYNIGFVLEKRILNNLIQKFWINPVVFFPNSNNNFDNIFRVNDSQLKYGQSYTYSLRQYISTNEVKYQYKSVEKIKQTTGVDATEYAYISLYQDIKFSNKIEIKDLNTIDTGISFVDLPPRDVFLQVYPRRGVNNEALFLFSEYSSEGLVEERIIPKQFWPEDKSWQKAKDYYLKSINQKSTNDDQVFFAETAIRKIKLYGTKEKPKNKYGIKTLISEIDVLEKGFHEELKIEPNTKYYFSATAVSATGLEGPPSQVYLVEIVDDGGAVFPLIKVINFEVTKKRKEDKFFSSKFRIEPALLQQAPNPPKDGIGYLNPSVFSSKDEARPQFKVRLTSKKTGKKVDFNIIYKQSFVVNGTDEGSLNLNVVTKDKVLISYNSSITGASKETKKTKEQIDELQIFIIGNVGFGLDESKVLSITFLKSEIIPAYAEIVLLENALATNQETVTLENSGLILTGKGEIEKRINDLYEFIALAYGSQQAVTDKVLAEKDKNLWLLTDERKGNIIDSLKGISKLLEKIEKLSV